MPLARSHLAPTIASAAVALAFAGIGVVLLSVGTVHDRDLAVSVPLWKDVVLDGARIC